MTQDTWHGCYDEGWGKMIVPEAYSHPAKMAYGLTRRIFKHALSEGWIKPGDTVVDPFGGIGSTGLVGACLGLRVVCVELEARFVDLGRQNFEKNRKAFELGHFGHSYQPVMIQGDSRKLCEILQETDCVISSPPYAGNEKSDYLLSEDGKTRRRDVKRGFKQGHGCFRGSETYGDTEGQLGAMRPGSVDAVVSSPPFQGNPGAPSVSESRVRDTSDPKQHGAAGPQYAEQTTPGNLAAMKPGSVDAVVSSPPYASGTVHGGNGIDTSKLTGNTPGAHSQALTMDDYGSSPGNIAAMKPGEINAIISSPPYQKQQEGGGIQKSLAGLSNYPVKDGLARTKKAGQSERGFGYHNQGDTDGQLGNSQGDTFWSAAKLIVEQCHQILRPGGVAIWVVKSFVRNKKKVDFPGDWRRLCEAVGFQTLHEHHATLVKPEANLVFDFAKNNRTERVSFFRRNANNKGAWRNYWQTIRPDQQRRWLAKTAKRTGIINYKKLLVKAQEAVFKHKGEVHWNWNDDIRIDCEVVLCMRRGPAVQPADRGPQGPGGTVQIVNPPQADK